jgi:hypothetical protein
MRSTSSGDLNLLAWRDLHSRAIIRLTDRKVKQTESVSGQNRIARCEVIEPDPSIANPDHTWRHVVSDVGPCSKLSPLVVDLDRITVGKLTRICVRPGYPELGAALCFASDGSAFPSS